MPFHVVRFMELNGTGQIGCQNSADRLDMAIFLFDNDETICAAVNELVDRIAEQLVGRCRDHIAIHDIGGGQATPVVGCAIAVGMTVDVTIAIVTIRAMTVAVGARTEQIGAADEALEHAIVVDDDNRSQFLLVHRLPRRLMWRGYAGGTLADDPLRTNEDRGA